MLRVIHLGGHTAAVHPCRRDWRACGLGGQGLLWKTANAGHACGIYFLILVTLLYSP